jgi:ribosome biogenesis GTPase
MKDKAHEYEDQFQARDKKHYRKERKFASAKDRSKYKKTDQDQLKKTKQSLPEGLNKGRVLAITPEGILVDSNGREFICTLKGSLKQEKNRLKNLIAVGDFVHFEMKSHTEGTIAFVEERRSILSRAEHHMQRMQQLIAVNIDQVLITVSVVHPILKPALVDRYIIAAKKGNMVPIIVINKIDLLKSSSEKEVQKEADLYHHFLAVYSGLGFAIFPVSAETGEGLEKLRLAMRNKASVFSGQSGTGKSSLINLLTGSSQDVGKVVAKTRKGSHTTTSAQLIQLEGGGFCIDTPGIKSFGVWDLSKQEIQAFFPEIEKIGHQCRFPDCSHLQEPDCAVQKAVEKGKISPLRFDSYCALIANVSCSHIPR